ncbi:TYW1 [Symbiodinium natans]|uniref:TYW1 protein n=1 Tax=Symbiodinium natans TaxID=878477 RepID=A0A812NKB5_9DINO|nr:TYW1 [Symbiodinium natans]
MPPEPEEPPPVSNAATIAGMQELWPSLGSAGHPELCYRRCLHFARGVCSHGSGCHFCHVTTHPPDRKMQRSDRELLHGLSLPDLLRVTWRVLAWRIQARRAQAEPIFEVLALELQDAQRAQSQGPMGPMGPAGRRPTDQELQALQWSLSRSSMNFASLITFISSRCRPASRDQLLALLAQMTQEARP